MKYTSRWFTLVELLVIIAIIGIIAAALFPSLMSYLARGRDAQRIASLKEIWSAIINYQTDNSVLPIGTSTSTGSIPNCTNTLILSNFIAKFPYDPNQWSSLSCGISGLYWYGTGKLYGSDIFILSVYFESQFGWNTYTGLTIFQWNALPQTTILSIDSLIKGSGSGYVIRN